MHRIFLSGVTGNIGKSIVTHLSDRSHYQYTLGVRNVDKTKKLINLTNNMDLVRFDFEDQTSFKDAFKGIDTVFLLRPPHISDVKKYFPPLLNALSSQNVRNIIFLSVQGVEKSSVIPHYKIEKLIRESAFNFIFIRPSYFMQNLITTLYDDLIAKGKIYLPSGEAKFNWVDADNIGELTAHFLENFNTYANQAFEVTGYENLSFSEVALEFKETLQKSVTYVRANPLLFLLSTITKNRNVGFSLVKFLLHFLPRFQREPEISSIYEEVTGKNPTTLKQFLLRENEYFQTMDSN